MDSNINTENEIYEKNVGPLFSTHYFLLPTLASYALKFRNCYFASAGDVDILSS